MYRNFFFTFSFSLILNCLSPAVADRWLYDLRRERQLNVTSDINEKGNAISSFENVLENSTTSGTEGDLFWTTSETNENTEEDVMVQMDKQEMSTAVPAQEEIQPLEEMETKEITEQDHISANTEQVETGQLDEKIFLQRMNCYLEMPVEDTYDLKIQIKFSQLQNNTSGKCCITLNGPENSLLAVFISGIYLFQNGSDGEVLQVIVVNHGITFVLKEYHHWSNYEPLLLTESHKVYLVLHYKVGTVYQDEQESHFDLEVLTYHKYENQIQPNTGAYSSAFPPKKVPNFNIIYG